MNEYLILEKDDISIAVDIVDDYAGDQIRGLQQDGFAVVCESTKAYTKDKALKLWSETKNIMQNNCVSKEYAEKQL
ncbi:hypothetical protein [Vibrio parahaemolyticus]|uniref:hypothetical protein n=1 Tax=Vibrio parahaemolyticus TaxID=670 RepID=UPI0015B87D4F|nr:hypothetical protein [Vibrio parahaemolyticus]QLE30757.1 hypothetical protein FDV78_09575 [Vibrio parahaemolyticus]